MEIKCPMRQKFSKRQRGFRRSSEISSYASKQKPKMNSMKRYDVSKLKDETIFEKYQSIIGGKFKALLDDRGGGGGSHIDMVYVYVPAFWGAFSRNLV